MGGDFACLASASSFSSFNPRPRMGGDARPDAGSSSHWGFNPRPRMGGDEIEVFTTHAEAVSIRAPAWGATWCAAR